MFGSTQSANEQTVKSADLPSSQFEPALPQKGFI